MNIIVAIDKKNGISKNNSIPWNIIEDIQYFNDVTQREYIIGKKNAVIMGSNTWKSLNNKNRGLKNRINIIISSSMSEDDIKLDNINNCECYLFNCLNDALEYCINQGIYCFVCGGSRIYNEALDYNPDSIYITEIDYDYECDNYFPKEKLKKSIDSYKVINQKHFILTDSNINKKITCCFTKYENKSPFMKIYRTIEQNKEEYQYLNIIEDLIKNGDFRGTRNSNTWSLFSKSMEFDLSKTFPILTTKKLFFRGVFEELLFFLKGDTNTNHLKEKGVNIWNENTNRQFLDKNGLINYNEGDMGPMYGYNWLHYGAEYKGMNNDYNQAGFNQLKYCIELIKNDPHSRRIILTTYNPSQAKEGVLYPCHGLFVQFYVEKGNKLSCLMCQRSGDIFLGVPFNLTSYSLLVYMLCEVINNDESYKGVKFTPGRLIIQLGDVHLYEDHYSAAIRQILREPFMFCNIKFTRKIKNLTDFKFEDIELTNYYFYPNILAKMVA